MGAAKACLCLTTVAQLTRLTSFIAGFQPSHQPSQQDTTCSGVIRCDGRQQPGTQCHVHLLAQGRETVAKSIASSSALLPPFDQPGELLNVARFPVEQGHCFTSGCVKGTLCFDVRPRHSVNMLAGVLRTERTLLPCRRCKTSGRESPKRLFGGATRRNLLMVGG